MKGKFGNEFLTGDYVLIIHTGGYCTLGFYLGKGKGDSIQYYSQSLLSKWMDHHALGNPRKSYVIDPLNERVVKYSISLVKDQNLLEIYKKAVEALKKLNIEVR